MYFINVSPMPKHSKSKRLGCAIFIVKVAINLRAIIQAPKKMPRKSQRGVSSGGRFPRLLMLNVLCEVFLYTLRPSTYVFAQKIPLNGFFKNAGSFIS